MLIRVTLHLDWTAVRPSKRRLVHAQLLVPARRADADLQTTQLVCDAETHPVQPSLKPALPGRHGRFGQFS